MIPGIFTPRQRALDLAALGLDYEFEISGAWGLVTKYAKSPWAMACMSIRGSELANLPWRIVDKASGETIKDHPIKDMLLDFGPEGNWSFDMRGSEINMCMSGAAYWLVDGGEVRRLDPSAITVKASRTGISYFEEKAPTGEVVNRYAREDVAYFREFSPAGDLQPGVPVMEGIKRAVAVEYESALYVEAFFKNDAVPGFLLSTDQVISQTKVDQVVAWFRQTFGGSRNKHKLGVADSGLKAQPLTPPLREIALVEIRDQARNDICAGMEVPKILVGAMEDATYANAQEARKFLVEQKTVPRGRYYESVINTEIVKYLDERVLFDFQPELLPILQEDQNAKYDRLSDAVDRGTVSAEFERQQMGWPETAAPPIPIELPAKAQVRSAYRRKAIKAFRRGESPDVSFVTDEMAPAEIGAIRARLQEAESEADVRQAFDA